MVETMAGKKTVRAGLVGSGFAAKLHIDGIRRLHGTNAEVVGVYSPTAAHARTFAEAHDIAAIGELDDLIEKVDVVHVCAPPVAHEPVAVRALAAGRHAIVEKPLTGFFGDDGQDLDGRTLPKQRALDEAMVSIARMLEAERQSSSCILYAENWVYAPAIQKEREVIEKTGAQILWLHGEEAHSGSHSKAYGHWRLTGGGSMIGKGCHPLSAALYLKRVEGRARDGRPIRPATVSGRTHSLTRLEGFIDQGHLRTDYHDVEDFSAMHVVFADGTIADIFASEIIMGGIHNWLEVAANNHRTVCNINPNTAMQTYNPVEANFDDIYVVEKIGTKQGWSSPAPDEDHFTGFPQEIEAFYRTVAYGEPVESDSRLAADTIATIYAAYLSAERAGAEVAVPRAAGAGPDQD
jgi:predicted dehydrogenase